MGALNSKVRHEAFAEELRAQGRLLSADDAEQAPPEHPWYEDVEVDELGCRVFPPTPPPGEHPRLLFTKEEIPFMLARLTHTHIGEQIIKGAQACSRQFKDSHRRKYGHLSDEQKEYPTREDVQILFKRDETRNIVWFSTLVYAVVTDNSILIDQVRFELLHYAKLILLSKQIAEDEGVKTEPFAIWHTNKFDLHTGQLFGGTAFALGYDLFFNDLSEDERSLYRSALASAVHKRRSWGMGWAPKRIQSNWAAYHGELLALCAAIEGEEGFDQEVYDLFEQLMRNYCQYAIYDSGHPIEDAYAVSP